MTITFDQNPFFSPENTNVPRDIPKRTGDIDSVHIRDKLSELGFTPGVNLSLGNFDQIGELTARKTRDPSNKYFHNSGFFFRPNYERGLLIYALIKYFKAESFLEVGFGRGYGSLCAAMAMHENGFGRVTTLDPNFNQDHLKRLNEAYPHEWFSRIQCVQGKSQDFLKSQDCEQKYDLIFIDGDHRYEAVKEDWELCEKKMGHAIVFDDYHLPEVEENNDIEVASVVDHIHGYNKQLIIADRRIFVDDRNLSDDEIKAGMVIVTKTGE
jgi:predicted O-methyltransferase YrrM